MTLFIPKDFKHNILEALMKSVENLEQKKKIIREWKQLIESRKIYQLKEEEHQGEFIHKFFGEVLGYTYHNHIADTHLRLEVKTNTDQTKADGGLGYFHFDEQTAQLTNEVRAIIELKDANTNLDKNQNRKDFKGSPVEQAFSYIPKFGSKCKWAIVSNFVEIRLYHYSDISRFERFEITKLLDNDNLAKFFFLLQKDRLFLENQDSPIDILLAERRIAEEKITLDFYNEYSEIREILFDNLRRNNPNQDPFELLSCTQKLLDRVIFMAFARDVIPTVNVIGDALKAEELLAYEQDNKLWLFVKGLFRSFDRGFSQKVPNFNGGLFAEDNFLEHTIILKDEQIKPLLLFVLKYDFQSELNVNILGHIFEQSITDLEEIRNALINGDLPLRPIDEHSDTPVKITNYRKRDGIFYTPDYVTRYMIKHSVGAWLDTHKEQLLAKYTEENEAYWQEYKAILLSIKVIDPACGSGAFLTQVFNYLWAEWEIVLAEIEKQNLQTKPQNGKPLGGMFENVNLNARQEWEVKKAILQNNIYGIDLNMESVAITKLAMWLLTANKLVTLADLFPNIKQGNSLINDLRVDEWAFDWKTAFPFQFDVVVGNPPYVRADIESETYQKRRKWITENFEFLYEKWDLMVAFYEKGLKLLKPEGYLSFISSESILTSKYAYKLQDWIVANFWVKRIDYFKHIEVFEGVGVVPTILLIKNTKPQNKIEKVFRETDFENTEVKKLELPLLTKEVVFRPDYQEITIKVPFEDLNNICYISVGMVINADELTSKNEFSKDDILSPVKTAIHTMPIVEGKDLKRYEIEHVKYLEWGTERVPSKLRRATFPELYQGEKILRGRVTGGIYDKTGITCNDGVMVFKRFIDLQAVNQKTISISLSKNHFSYEGSKDSKTVELKRKELEQISQEFYLKYLLGIMNSKFAYWYLNNSRRHRLQNYFYPDDFRFLPIAKASKEKQQTIVQKVEVMLSQNQFLAKTKDDFWQLIPQKSKPKKISRRLEDWHLLDWETFQSEMQKVRIDVESLPTKKKQVLKNDFDEFKKEAFANQLLLDKTDQEIDQLIYQLYQFTPEEIAIIENGK